MKADGHFDGGYLDKNIVLFFFPALIQVSYYSLSLPPSLSSHFYRKCKDIFPIELGVSQLYELC